MSRQILYPEQVTAMRIGNESKVTIVARGHEDGYCNIQIDASMAEIYPPIFMVTGEPCAVIGYFPYQVSKTIPYSTDLDYVNFQTANGTERIPIYDVMKDTNAVTPQALKAVASDQVVGYAYNSTDISKAISDAVSKLQQQHPGNVNAKLVESGFVAAGSPVGIAYYYVVMEQQS